VPDVAGEADPETGYRVLVDGQSAVFGGTSAVAPLWAALLIRCAQSLGHSPGYLNPLLYQTLESEGVTRDITQGNNGAYKAGLGWDPCTGWGSPRGAKFLAGLKG
jgi:kumamolisin